MRENPSDLIKTEARAALRYSVSWPVELENGKAVTCNISTTGMYLRSKTEFEQNEKIRFSVLLRKTALERLECDGRVTRVERCADRWFGIAVALREFSFSSLDAFAA